MRLLFITDFTEQFAYRLLQGVLHYAEETEQWVVCKMPPAHKQRMGIQGVLDYALRWRADVIIGQFDPNDDVRMLRDSGIVTIAQDYISKFDCIPNITADYEKTGEMAANRFLSRGFQNFGFFGLTGVCWSEERCNGFRHRIEQAGFGGNFYKYDRQRIDNLWSYDPDELIGWIEKLPKPIAILACDDNQASILLQACNVYGLKIPSEAAIIGVDNDEVLCNMSAPSLSSINIDIEGGGYDTARMAERMKKDPSYPGEDIILRPMNIVSRMSSNIFATRDSAVLTALQFISANIERRIMVKDVLEQVPLSRRLLEQRFLKETGTTLYQYITHQRMDRFAQLLLESNDSIANIANRLEEDDTKSISRRFLAVKGCTPSEFRKREMRKMGVK
ncbi:MAG: DNA-binding transcriptional regulator [Bacteroidales bacterium]|nr:DNA-binding transcriptional regulator [Bacteroidales bacterium]